MKNLEIREDHVRVEDMLVNSTEHCSEDSVEDGPGGEVTKFICHPTSIPTDVIIGCVEMRREILDCSHKHRTTNCFTCLSNQLPRFVHLVAEDVPIHLHADIGIIN